jgi:hypothetical protein
VIVPKRVADQAGHLVGADVCHEMCSAATEPLDGSDQAGAVLLAEVVEDLCNEKNLPASSVVPCECETPDLIAWQQVLDETERGGALLNFRVGACECTRPQRSSTVWS